jgi:hypothetical protein
MNEIDFLDHKLIDIQLINKLLGFYGNPKLIIMFTTTH